MAVVGVLACAGSALARSESVLPPCETPYGYSLSDIAVKTAVYNVGDYLGDTEPLPKVPFEILVGDATVKPDAMLYVPVYFVDNAPPLTISPFPTDKEIRDQDADAEYIFDVAGVEAFVVQVDEERPTILCDDYVVGVKTAKLPDGGNRYIVSAAFLAPLTPGVHTVGIGGVIDGEPQVFLTYTVTVSGDGNVLAPDAKPKGYSLSKMAVDTAVYNTGYMTGNPLTPPPPKVPFEILVADATVKPDTMLYMPVFVVDDSGDDVAPGFPTDITDQDADAEYFDSVTGADPWDVTAFFVVVDGKTTMLDDDYVVGVKTAPLLDGTPAGTHYIVSAVFLTPLTLGNHTVGIGGIIGGEPIVVVPYTVTVKP
jgi:hypothetical protein